MNSISEKKRSLDELKKLNSLDLTAASEGERHITLTDRNWTAVLNLLGRLSSQQLELQAALALLLTKPDTEELLNRIERNTQTQLRVLNRTAERFEQQAGSMSESFSTSAERVVSTSEITLHSLESSTEKKMQELTSRTQTQISELIQTARLSLVTLGVASLSLTVLLTVLFSLVALWRL